MRAQFHKSLVLPLVIIGAITLVVVSQVALAAPPDNPDRAINQLAQESGITLEKIASKETVPLGGVVSYTVTIKNVNPETINPTLTDALPEGLVLQTASISATVGQVEAQGNTLLWSGSLGQDEEANIFYEAIPPSTSTPDQTLSNIAVLSVGGTSLEAGTTITTQPPDLSLWGRFINLLAVILVSLDNVLSGLSKILLGHRQEIAGKPIKG